MFRRGVTCTDDRRSDATGIFEFKGPWSAGPLSRHCQPTAGIAGHFLKHCGFPVIYFISNIFFVGAPKPRAAARAQRGLNGRG
jgi:hypothetical protein